MSEMENVGPCIEVPVRKVLLFRLRRFIRQFRRRFVPYVIWHGQQVDVRIVFTDAPLGGARKSRLPYMEIEQMFRDHGIWFDKGCGASGREWELDWSLQGPVHVTMAGKSRRRIPRVAPRTDVNPETFSMSDYGFGKEGEP